MKIDQLSDITPLIMILDKNGKIIQISSRLEKHLGKNYAGLNILEIFDFTRPSIEYIRENTFSKLTTHLFLFTDKRTGFAMRGQVNRKDEDHLWLIISPWLTYLELNKPEIQLSLPDFMRSDTQLELKVLLSTQNMMMADMDLVMEELKNSLAVQKRFLGNISHELKSPLHTIIAATELISFNKNQDENNSLYIKSILESSNILLSTINQILDYSKSVGTTSDTSITAIDLRDICNKVFSIFKIRSELKEIEFKFEYDLPENLPKLIGNATKITNSLINLLTYAFRNSHNEDIIFRFFAAADIDDKFNLRFEIEKESAGIEKHQLPDFFMPFSDSNSYSKTSDNYSDSTGLELSITKNYIESMNGKIGYIKPKNKKAFILWFSLTLSKSFLNEEINQSKNIKNEINNFTKKILIVDDIPLNCKLTSLQFEKIGINTVCCYSGFQALELLKENNFDLILLDIQMPDMDGFETILKIKALENFSMVKVFAWTATITDELESLIISHGFSGILTKPTSKKIISDFMYKYYNQNVCLLKN